MNDMQISFTGRIAYDPRFWSSDDDKPAMWSALVEVAGPPKQGRNGTYVPTRRIEVIAYDLDAIRASESYHVGHMITVLGHDLLARAYEGKDRRTKQRVLRGVVQVVAETLAMSTRYDPVRQQPGTWPPSSPRMSQGAGTPVIEEEGQEEPVNAS